LRSIFTVSQKQAKPCRAHQSSIDQPINRSGIGHLSRKSSALAYTSSTTAAVGSNRLTQLLCVTAIIDRGVKQTLPQLRQFRTTEEAAAGNLASGALLLRIATAVRSSVIIRHIRLVLGYVVY